MPNPLPRDRAAATRAMFVYEFRPPLAPKRYSRIYPKVLGIRGDGYGERRVAREIARSPMFAALPGWVDSAANYEARMAEHNQAFTTTQRQRIAAGWRRVRRWLASAGAADVTEFYRRWEYVPHAPEYALDAITQIERRRGQ